MRALTILPIYSPDIILLQCDPKQTEVFEQLTKVHTIQSIIGKIISGKYYYSLIYNSQFALGLPVYTQQKLKNM